MLVTITLNISWASNLVMKNLNETFTDEEFSDMQTKKGDKTWRDFLLELTGVEKR